MATVRRLWRRPALFVVTLSLAAIMLGLAGEIPVLPAGKHVDARRSGRQSWAGQRATAPFERTTIEIVLRGVGLLIRAGADVVDLARTSIRACADGFRLAAGSGWLLDAAKTISMTPRMPLVIYLIAYLLIANVLWFYNDRYLIVLLPVVVALASAGANTVARCHAWRGSRLPSLPW